MTTYQHKCPKCSEAYSDNDPEVYFCPKCVEERKNIAKAIDAKMANRPKKVVVSELQEYDRLRAKSRGYVNIRDLGIKL